MPHAQTLALHPAPSLRTPLIATLAITLPLWAARQRSRRALTRLAAEQLQDIGLSTAAARAESQKPFWRD